jgi:hypothetical protein
MKNSLPLIASKLLHLSGFCPLCGNDQAENNEFHTKCHNMSCSNYDVEYGLKTKALSEAFGNSIDGITAGLSKLAYGEISRIVYEADPKAALSLALRHFNDLTTSVVKKLQKVILENGTADQVYLFAKDVKEADVKLLEQRVLSLGNVEVIYVFAKNIDNADIKSAETAIIDSGNSKYIRLFIQNVEGANIPRLEQALSYILK